MLTSRDAAASKGGGSSQGGNTSAIVASGKDHVPSPHPAVDEIEQQVVPPEVSFHEVMQGIQQRMNSMDTEIGTLNVYFKYSPQASQPPSTQSRPKKSSPSRSKAANKKAYNTTSDDDDDDEWTESSAGTDIMPIPNMEKFTLRTFYLADESAMRPVAISDPRLTDQVNHRRYRVRKRKALLRSEE
jgi:hypothetical protein